MGFLASSLSRSSDAFVHHGEPPPIPLLLSVTAPDCVKEPSVAKPELPVPAGTGTPSMCDRLKALCSLKFSGNLCAVLSVLETARLILSIWVNRWSCDVLPDGQ